jgi:hypothetical protein
MYRVLNEPTITPPTPPEVTDVLLEIYGGSEITEPAYLDCYLYNGVNYVYAGRMAFGLAVIWRTLTVTTILNTPTKIVNTRLKLVFHPTVEYTPNPMDVFRAKLVYGGNEYYVISYTEEYIDANLVLTGTTPYLQDTLDSYVRQSGGPLGSRFIRYWEFAT